MDIGSRPVVACHCHGWLVLSPPRTLPRGFTKKKTLNFTCSIDDISGYNFLVPEKLCRTRYQVLQASRPLCYEILLLAFRRTTSVAEISDDPFEPLTSLGRIGRANMEDLEFGWLAKDIDPFPPISWAARIVSRMERTRRFPAEFMEFSEQ